MRFRLTFMACLSALLFMMTHLTPTVTAEEAKSFDQNWRQLFNGKDLKGWNKIGNEKWVVDEGTILGAGITQEYGYLATEKQYSDFILFLKFKCEADGNSGVYLHTDFAPGTATVTQGRQVEIDRTAGNANGGLYGDGVGWITKPDPKFAEVIKPADWNEMLIRVDGKHYVVHLNGVKVLDYVYETPKASSGVIALQLHSGGQGRMRFKDIWLRDLTKSPETP